MSALDLPPEVTVTMMKKLRPVDSLRLYSAGAQFAELRYEKSLEKSMENITPSQLCQLHAELPTTNQKNQCFHKQVMDRLEKDTFNELVHLYMRSENNDFLSNNKILVSYGNEIILVEEPNMPYASDFWSCCKNLLEMMDGEIFLTLVGIDEEQLWDGNDGINFRSRVKYLLSIDGLRTFKHYPNLVFRYFYSSRNLYDNLMIANPHNGVDTMKFIISIMKSNVLQGARKQLESALPIIQARIAHQHDGWFYCDHCGTGSYRGREGGQLILYRTTIQDEDRRNMANFQQLLNLMI